LSLAHIDIHDEFMHTNQPASSPPDLIILSTQVKAASLNWCQPHVNDHFEVMDTNQSATSPIESDSAAS
jgi:hypothetical protein